MRRSDILIKQIRRQTENEDVGTSFGISNEEFLQYINDAQHRLQSVVTATHPLAFVHEKVYTITGSTTYPMPTDALMDNKIVTLEYKSSQNDDEYYHLAQASLQNRISYDDSNPVAYIRRSGSFLLQPSPNNASGGVRLNYVKRVWDLDTRRAIVLAATTTGSTITTLTADVANSKTPVDSTKLQESDYLCIVDKDGIMKMRNIPITAYNTGTGDITIDTYSFEDGETLSAGDYIVSGKDTSTHSEFPKMAERYLIAYASWKILKRDSSVDYAEQQQELQQMEADITNSFAVIDDDIHTIPVINRWW